MSIHQSSSLQSRRTHEGDYELKNFSQTSMAAMVTGIGIGISHLLRHAPLAATEAALMVAGIQICRVWVFSNPTPARMARGSSIWLGICTFTLFVSAISSGGPKSLSLWYFALAPMIAGMLISARAARVWLGVAVVGFLTVYAMPHFVSLPQQLHETEGDQLVAQLFEALGMCLAGIAFRRTFRGQVDFIGNQAHEITVARDQAVAASRAKSDFLANMSHELRTPLHGIKIALELLLNDAFLSARHRQLLTTASVSADYAHREIENILDFSLIEAGGVVVNSGAFSIHSIVRQSVGVVRAFADHKGLDVTSHISESVPALVVGDGVKIRQVLINLLSNAVKFTSEGAVSLEASWNNDRATFVVADTGPGIPEEARERIFEKFEQADPTVRRSYGGVGLGLSIVKEIASALSGRLEVNSKVGEGTKFTFWMPLPEPEGDEAMILVTETAALAPPLEPRISTLKAGPMVLIIDDNVINANVAGEVLELMGCRYKWENDSKEAIERVRTGEFAAVILDMHMPEITGGEIAQAIRSLGTEVANVPLICLTADSSEANLRYAVESGIDTCLTKPARILELREALSVLGVLGSEIDTALLSEARKLLLVVKPNTVQALELIAQCRENNEVVLDRLRDGTDTRLFLAAHENFQGMLVFLEGLLEGDLDESKREKAITCLDRAIAWDQGPVEGGTDVRALAGRE